MRCSGSPRGSRPEGRLPGGRAASGVADNREARAPVDATTRVEASIDQEVFWDADFGAYAGEEENHSHNCLTGTSRAQTAGLPPAQKGIALCLSWCVFSSTWAGGII